MSAGLDGTGIAARVHPPYNNDIPRNGKVYHVQTEDLGHSTRSIVTHVFCAGQVIDARRCDYPQLEDGDALIKSVLQLMREQHRDAMKSVLRLDEAAKPPAAKKSPVTPTPAFLAAGVEENAISIASADTAPLPPADASQQRQLETILVRDRADKGAARQSTPPPRPSLRTLPRDRWGRLEVLSGRQAGRTFTLDKTPMAIGCQPDRCEIHIEDPALTARHCLLFCEEGWQAVGLAGSGAIMINGRRGGRLSSGDVLEIGSLVLRFTIVAGPGEGMVSIPAVKLEGTSLEIQRFELDEAPVTNRAYAEYVAASGAPAPEHWIGRNPPEDRLDHPVVGVSLNDARRYASWCKKRLPTHLEWQAAALGDGGRAYPWGEELGPEHCAIAELGARGTVVVGTCARGRSLEGCVDLYGNVWEWTEIDPRGERPEEGQSWVMGGAYNTVQISPRRAPRTAVSVGKSYLYLGFRCARDATEGA